MTCIPAPPETLILQREDDNSIIYIPVVAYSIVGTMAFPITPLPIAGLLKGRRALQTPDGLIIDRGSPTPFRSTDEWLAYCANVEPESDVADLAAEFVMPDRAAPDPVRVTAGASRYVNPETPVVAAGTTTLKPRAKKDEVFQNKTFWMRATPSGITQIAICEGGLAAPRRDEGWGKIKREEYADFKRLTKADPATVEAVEWPAAVEAAAPADADEDEFGGLV